MRYVLITPARNEGENIGRTLEAMVAQTCRPLAWVIVSDGSTDQTEDIVAAYLQEHNWIQLIRRPNRPADIRLFENTLEDRMLLARP